MALSWKLILLWLQLRKDCYKIFSKIKNNNLGGLVSGCNVQAAKS